MSTRFLTRRPHYRACLFSLVAVIAVVSFSESAAVRAQQHLSKRYPTGKNVRIELKNISGTITVESWNRDEIKLTATMESPSAHIIPRQIDEQGLVDVMADNRGRGDVGDVNFVLQVPVNSSVDL